MSSDIITVADARVPATVPNGSRNRMTAKVKVVVRKDGDISFGCRDCTFSGKSFNSVAAHRKVHVRANKAAAEPVIGESHLGQILAAEVISVVDKALFAEREETRKLNRELSRTKAALKSEREARRKAERTLKRIKEAI
jgi:hypothetical protein